MQRTFATIAAIAVICIASGCASSAGTSGNQDSTTSNFVSGSTPPQTSPAPQPAPPASTTTHKTTPAATHATSTAADDGSFIMPNEVGKDLQSAQDDIQRVSNDPVFFSHSKDATGQDRFQVIDSNWQVCSQNVAPGTRVPFDAHIVFNVVKLNESCP